jgi:DNA repair protein RadC
LSQSPRQQLEQFGAKPMTTIDLLSAVTNPEAKQPDQSLVDFLASQSGNLRALSDLDCHQMVEQSPTISIQQAVQISAVIEQSAASIILVHNHPSGDPKLSSEDIRTAKQLGKAGEYIQITVLDHVIIGDRDYTSLKEASREDARTYMDCPGLCGHSS